MIFMTYTIYLIMVSMGDSQGKVGQRFSDQFSFSLSLSELQSHISVFILLCSRVT